MSHVIEVNESNCEQVLSSPFLVLLLWEWWCVPSRSAYRMLCELAENGGVSGPKLAALHLDEEGIELAITHCIHTWSVLPATLIYRHGCVVSTMIGTDFGRLRKMLKSINA